jgi:hypothetical protein
MGVPAKRGRPTSYKPEFVEQGYSLALLGATDAEMAAAFDISVDSLNVYKDEYPEFSASLKAGKTAADARMAESLYKRGLGFEFTEKQPIKLKEVTYNERGQRQKETERIEIVDVQRVVPPDTTAAIFWLKNRRRTEWRDHSPLDPASVMAVFAGIKIVIGSEDTTKGEGK